MSRRASALFFLLPGLLLVLALLNPAPALARDWPRPDGPVADIAQVIPPEARREIETMARQLMQRTQVAVVVATLPSLEGRPLEETAVDLFRQWGIGKKDVNKGLLLMVAVKEKRLRLEVGYGLESVITDSLAGHIRDQVMIPHLRKGDYGQGLSQGLAAVAREVYRQAGLSPDEFPPVQAAPVAKPRKEENSGWGLGLVVLFFILVIYLIRKAARRGYSGGGGFWSGMFLGSMWGSGGRRSGGSDGSGGFDGFGGGSSGGGGASGDFGDGGGGDSGGGSDGD